MEKRLNVIRCCYQGENGYTVLLCDEVSKEGKALACSLSCIGYYLPTTPNRILVAELQEKVDKKYGKQFEVKKFETEDPKDKLGIIDIILSCKLKGIGKAKAERIYEAYGARTLEILDNDFLQIGNLKNMPKDLDTPMKQWRNSRDLRLMMSMLGSNIDVSQRKLLKIRKHFKENTVGILKSEPYRVMEIHGMDFKFADSIAYNCEEYVFAYNDIERIKAGIKQALLDGMLEGHLFLLTSQIISKVKTMLKVDNITVCGNDVKKGLNALFMSGDVKLVKFAKEYGFYLRTNYDAEQSAAEKIVEIIYSDKSSDIDEDRIEREICKHEKKESIKLANRQKQAVKYALSYPMSIITGGPGRGKTTVINTILNVYKEFFPKNKIMLMAPTGRAARRMSETTGKNASTIHSALGLRTEDDMSMSVDELDADMVIVDEMSMVDMKLFATLISKLRKKCKVILVGDKDQLSSVGAGNVFAELISSNVIPITILDAPFRQKENDLVFINAERINEGNTNIIEGVTFKFIDATSQEEIQNLCLKYYREQLIRNNNDLDSVFMLTPFRRKSLLGANELNKQLQSYSNTNDNKLLVKAYGKTFCKGDKVMQLKNIVTEDGLSLSNGDIGYIIGVSAGTENDSSVTVEFKDIGIKEYSGHDDFDMLELAYATTVHKAQGSEAKTVIMPISNIFNIMLKRNLVYTAVSRAKENIILIGNRNSLKNAILNNNYAVRNTLLCWRLQNEKNKYDAKKLNENTFKQLSFV
ncbi:AAA family ATPase [uncultured Eubacterium sp.]|uniref:SF1B family DNA helicase RecD2 n=1 Tax=uncultured Eubacterium sp. TaxID=165185 RepID=UPI002674CFCF|nr:AAA family ATPase [uncultured Eubacterium sp.]